MLILTILMIQPRMTKKLLKTQTFINSYPNRCHQS